MTYQLTAPLLDACVLGIVNQEDSYGYTLTQKMRQVVDISESTLYPVLRRLQKAGQLRTYDAPFQGRNRRYYAITDAGKNLLDYYGKEWIAYKEKIDGLLSERQMPEGAEDAKTVEAGSNADAERNADAESNANAESNVNADGNVNAESTQTIEIIEKEAGETEEVTEGDRDE